MSSSEARLIITEKPRVAQKLAAALSSKPTPRALHGVTYFELLDDSGKKVFVAPAVGHVYTLAQKEKGSSYPVFDIGWIPSSEQRKESAYTKKYLDVIEKLAKESSEVVNAADFDIEGSLIGGNLIKFACKNKPAKRMVFSTLTPEDLQEAYANLQPLDTANISAGETRHILDWFWGINLSRALMSSIRKAGMFKVMSIGRVQGPSLAFLAKREKEISDFKPQKYWQLFAIAKDTKFLHEKDRFFDSEECEKALEECKAHLSDATIKSIERRTFKQMQPFPFDLTSLQMESYGNFGISPSRTLEIAQSLYEQALISYPRTSSQKLPAKLNLSKIIQSLQKNPIYSDLCSVLISKKRFIPREGEKDDAAHPAIHPTGQKSERLSPEEQKLYDLIVKRFLSSFAEPAIRESMKVILQISSHLFSAEGTRTVEDGWFAFYKPYLHLEEVTLPEFKEGERVSVERIFTEEKETQPPKRYTPASLIKELERKNLGTKSTRSAVIDTLYARHYLSGTKSIEVTEFGLSVFSALSNHVPEILSEELTRAFEEHVENIQSGKEKEQDIVNEGKKELSRLLEKFQQKELAVGKELLSGFRNFQHEANILGKCNKCEGGKLKIRVSKYGQFVGCSNYPNCRNLYPLPKEGKIIPTDKTCEKCGTPLILVKRNGKKPFRMCLDTKCETKKDWGRKNWKKDSNSENKEASTTKTEPVPSKSVSASEKTVSSVENNAKTIPSVETTSKSEKPTVLPEENKVKKRRTRKKASESGKT